MIMLRIDIDPLERSEWREELAVMETGSITNPVVSWGSHHWRLDKGLGLVVVVSVLQVLPDPEGASVEWTKIGTDSKFLSVLVVPIEGGGASH